MTRRKNQTAKPNTEISPEIQEESSKPSSKPLTLRPPKDKDVNREDHALWRFGVRESELAKAPSITPLLESALGNWHKAINVLRFSSDGSATNFLSTYDSLPQDDRDRVPIEAICIRAGVDPVALLGATLMAARQLSAQESALIAITEHPGVVKATAYFARMGSGSKDREMLHQAVGFLPTSKGTTMNVNLLGGNPQLAGSDSGGGDDDEDSFEKAFPSLNSHLESWNDRRRKLLEKGK